MSQNDAMMHYCFTHALGFIAKSFLKQFGSNRARKFLLPMLIENFDMTCSMTVLRRCALCKIRQLVIQGFGPVFFKEQKSSQNIGNLKDGGRDKFDTLLKTFLKSIGISLLTVLECEPQGLTTTLKSGQN